MDKLLKKLDFLGSTILKAVVLASAVMLTIGVFCVLFLLLSLAIDLWAVVILGVLFYIALVVGCYLGFKEREKGETDD